jgi:3-hydroxybutyryl-CoA dehydrogenase
MQSKLTGAETELVYVKTVTAFLSITADAYFDLEFEIDPERITSLAKLLPAPVFINSVVHTLAEIGRPFIRINAWPGFLRRTICETAVSTETAEASAKAIFTALNWSYQTVPDLPGMVSARVIATIINEAYYAFQENISSREEIDIAMKLGTNYPYGLFEWAKQIGLKNVYTLLMALSKTDQRYAMSEALRKEAAE